jgi:ComF family protein
MKITQTLSLVREYLFPAGCASCGRTLLDAQEAWFGLCADCRPAFPLDGGRRCSACWRPLISERTVCMRCRTDEKRSWDALALLYPYTGKTRALLNAYKFGVHRNLARFFADKLTEGTRAALGGEAVGIPWVPVPPSAGKLKKAGWDQMERIAHSLEAEHGVVVRRCLKRLPSAAQKSLGRANRQTNLRGKIVCKNPPPEALVLFDDVFTTGATMRECTETLKSAGAKRVLGVCLLYS